MKNTLLFLLSITLILTGCPGPSDTSSPVITPDPQDPAKTGNSITLFEFRQTDNSFLAEDYSCLIDDSAHTVTCELPESYSDHLNSLIPYIEISDGATISPASGTAADFTSSLVFTVTAEDGTAQTYTTTVTTYSEADRQDSSLSNIIMYKEGGFDLDMDFNTSTTIYEVNTTSSVESVRFKCTTTSSLATVKAWKEGESPETPNSYGYTSYLNLDDGLNTFNIEVTSYDQSSTTTYVIKVTKGDDLTVSVGEGWTTGLLTDDEELTENGFLWYSFPAEVGHYYQIAVDGDNESTYSDCWTPDNGGWEDSSGNGPTAHPYYNVYREDGTTLYETPEQDETTIPIDSTVYSEYMSGDYKYYVTIQALDENVKIKITQHESSNVTYAHTFAIQVRERTDFPEPIEVSEGAWFETSVPEVTDLWTYYDVPTYHLTMTEGVRYRVGIDDGTNTWDDDGGWNTAGVGVSTTPTASQVKMQLLTPAGDNYDYEEGDSGWVDTDRSGTSERRFATITALDSDVYMEVDPSSSGTFAIQYRPVVLSVTAIATSTEWLDVVQTETPGYWGQEWHFSFPVEAGKTYRMAVDDRGDDDDVNWTVDKGGSANTEETYLVYRILKSDGTSAEFKEDWREAYYDGNWYRADESDTIPPSDDQRRYLTFTAEETSVMTMEVKNVLYYVSGTFAVQLRELPEPTEIPVDNDWHGQTFAQEGDPWDMGNYSAFSFPSTAGTTYYISVDGAAGGWTPSNGGMSTVPTAYVYYVDAPGPYYTTRENFNSSNDYYLTIEADSDREAIYFWTWDSTGNTGLTYGIRISTTEPIIEE